MFSFLWLIIWYTQLVPFAICLIYPFYKVSLRWYYRYCFHALKIKTIITKDSEYIEEGFILANHRSFFDFLWDPAISNAVILGRRLAFLVFLFNSIFCHLQCGIIPIHRGKDSRQVIFSKMKKCKLVLFWPEGTRLRYDYLSSPEDVKKYIRYGILKEIYYHNKLPVQLQISSNKEKVVDERKFIVKKGVTVKTHISAPIYPVNYNTEQEFYNAIAEVWYDAWKRTHNNLKK